MADLEPYWTGLDDSIRLHHGDCLTVMATLPDCSVEAVITDPPYGLSDLTPARVTQAVAVWVSGDRLHVPGGGGFMGRSWDSFVPPPGVWDECMRVMKPGAHLLCFAAPRSVDLMTLSIRLAGFEIRDNITWMRAQGYPKSHDVSKAIDRAAPRTGMFAAFAEHFATQRKQLGLTLRQVAECFPSKTGGLTGCAWNWENAATVPTLAQWRILAPMLHLSSEWQPLIERIEAERDVTGTGYRVRRESTAQITGLSGDEYDDITAPATEESARWDGWGTALKPAGEMIVVARKPLAGTVAANVLEYHTGAININACRVNGAPRPARTNEVSATGLTGTGGACTYGSFAVRGSIAIGETDQGRWPANVVFSHAEGCRPAGARDVASSARARKKLAGAENFPGCYGSLVNTEDRGYGTPGRPETVQVWECVPGCPVAELDAQAGPRVSGANPERRSADNLRDAYGEFKGEQACVPARGADAGAASRFFPVFHPGGGGEPPQHAAGCRPVVASDSDGCVTGCPVAELDAQSGVTRSTSTYTCMTASRNRGVYSPGIGDAVGSTSVHYGDVGTASRFFPAFRYEPKAGPDERPRLADGTAHVAVKPLELMKWLVRLVVPQGAVVLDPFAGTGTTGRACAVEGMQAILIEQDEKHCQMAVLKLSGPVQQALFPDPG